jgi:hypothetical protein
MSKLPKATSEFLHGRCDIMSTPQATATQFPFQTIQNKGSLDSEEAVTVLPIARIQRVAECSLLNTSDAPTEAPLERRKGPNNLGQANSLIPRKNVSSSRRGLLQKFF